MGSKEDLNESNQRTPDDCQNTLKITEGSLPDMATKQQTLANHVKQIDAPSKPQKDVKVTSIAELPNPSTSQSRKRPANEDPTSNPSRNPSRSTLGIHPSEEELQFRSTKYLVKLSNLPKGIEEINLLALFRGYQIRHIHLFCTKDLYHPTAEAFIKLVRKDDTKAVMDHHHDIYRGKRICIRHVERLVEWEFTPERSVMLKNLPKAVTEEGLMRDLSLFKLKVLDVHKPTHHYAYVEFTEDTKVDARLLSELQNALDRSQITVFRLYQNVPKSYKYTRLVDIRTIKSSRVTCGTQLKEDAKDTDGEFGAHNAHKMFVGNIPRDTLAEDVIDYFNNFGTVIDYVPIEKKSCCLRKSAMLSFVDSRHAQNTYRLQPHFLEGSVLDVHLMDGPPAQYPEDTQFNLITVKTHSTFLTNDEIRNALEKDATVVYQLRFDAFSDRVNYYANIRIKRDHTKSLFEIKYINDEAVKIVPGCDPTPPTEDEAREKENISNSPYRQQKMKYLNSVIGEENFKNEMEMGTKPNSEANVPALSFYDDTSVQINNAALGTTLEDLQDLFIKCGDIVDYRAFILLEDDTKICFVKFKTDLSADLACTYNQRLLHGKRILVHLTKETPYVEHDRSILVERFHPATTTEQLHAAFNADIKYVQKQSQFSAIVCFRDKKTMMKAATMTAIPIAGPFTINPCDGEYNPLFFNHYFKREEIIPIERMQAALRSRILPEFHQLEVDRRILENLPDAVKRRLVNEVFLARIHIPGFCQLSKPEQIHALIKKYPNFTQKEHFLRMRIHEQIKLLDLTSYLQQNNYEPSEAVEDQEVLAPAPKQNRTGEPVNEKPNKSAVSNGQSGATEKVEPTPGPHGSHKLSPLQNNKQLARTVMNNAPPFRKGPPFPNRHRLQQGPSRFAPSMPQFGNRSWPPNPHVGPIMRSSMNGNAPARGVPPDFRRIQQWKAAMAYYVGLGRRGQFDLDGFY